MSLKDRLATLTEDQRRDLAMSLLWLDSSHTPNNLMLSLSKLEIVELGALMMEGALVKMAELCPPAEVVKIGPANEQLLGWYAYEAGPPPIKKPDGTVLTINMVLTPGMPVIAETLFGPVLGELRQGEGEDTWYVENDSFICPVVISGVEYCCNSSINKKGLENINITQ